MRCTRTSFSSLPAFPSTISRRARAEIILRKRILIELIEKKTRKAEARKRDGIPKRVHPEKKDDTPIRVCSGFL
jgi:hypothetical protein